jgi:molybdopterin molybdotransferase
MPSASTSAGSISFEEARHIVEEQAAKLHGSKTELILLLESPGRILAEDILADRPFPPFPRAARDGYALRASDIASIPTTLDLVGEVKAGDETTFSVGKGEAAAIMTGAAVPSGADAVVMVENTILDGKQVEIHQSIESGANIVPTGSEAQLGEVLLPVGIPIDHVAVSVAASVGKSSVQVFTKPRIAILSTGDEVVGIDVQPKQNQIRNSNSYSLAAQVGASGGEPVLLPVAPDETARLRQLIEQGMESDLLLLAGGVSMGTYDLVEQVLAEFGAEFFFTSVAIQPGKPAVFGRCITLSGKQLYFFGLPGNPVSTMVTFELFARPMIEALSGSLPRKLRFLHARLGSPIKTKPGLKRFLPAQLSGEFEHAEVERISWQGSGDIASTARANCYLVIPPDRTELSAGEWVPILLR